MAEPLRVVATAGHVDHGKSSLILRLTGMDPDRWREEKRRGLTIDLGFAWTALPSGREVGFVDVPGHERFIRNMLAGVGPVRLVLFVVAADEGWKPQSEEHLQIVDVLGAEGAVVALTKVDLVDRAEAVTAAEEVRDRLAGTALATAPVVPTSSATGTGLDALRDAIDAMVGGAVEPEVSGRPRVHIDRSFTIAGAGTVVTGTLTGGTIAEGDEVRVYPQGPVARVRSLQTHRRTVQEAVPVSRVAANLAGVARSEVERGDVLALPRDWRPTSVLEAHIVAVRGLTHAVVGRGAHKMYLGSAERDVRLRLFGTEEIRAGETAFVRIRASQPVVAAWGDRFVLREAGRQETVAGGRVLDPDPPSRPGADPEARLRLRGAASMEQLPEVVVRERGAVRAADLVALAGTSPGTIPGAVRIGSWWVSESEHRNTTEKVGRVLSEHHRANPLLAGMPLHDLSREVSGDIALADELIGDLAARGLVHRKGPDVRWAAYAVTVEGREEEAGRLVAEVERAEPRPPTVTQVEGLGFPRDLTEVAVVSGLLVLVEPDLLFTPGFLERAAAIAAREAARPEGLTVGRFREILGTTRKYALPLLRWLDERGVTRRDGDVRRPAGRP